MARARRVLEAVPDQKGGADAAAQPAARNAHDRIVDAALELFLRDGYGVTTVADIADAAETSRATFYAQFNGKTDVLAELVERFVEEAMDVFAEFARLPDTTQPSVQGWMERVVRLWERDASLIRLLMGNHTPEAVEVERARLERAVDLVTRNPDHWATLTLREARARAFVLVVLLRQTLAEWALFNWPVEASELVKTITDIWCATLHRAAVPDSRTES
jgi:AcrR family transcriptional regulator